MVRFLTRRGVDFSNFLSGKWPSGALGGCPARAQFGCRPCKGALLPDLTSAHRLRGGLKQMSPLRGSHHSAALAIDGRVYGGCRSVHTPPLPG